MDNLAQAPVKFIRDDEFIILMEDQNGGKYAIDDLKRLRDVGIQTIVRYPFWKDIEQDWHSYDWSSIDRAISDGRSAGLKTMLAIYDHAPLFFPEDWYFHFADGRILTDPDTNIDYERLMSPWNADGWRYHLGFIDRCCERYNAADVLCFRSALKGGSVMLPEMAGVRIEGDVLETVMRVMLEEQMIFESHPSREIWTTLHPTFDKLPWSGNAYRYEIYEMLQQILPNARHQALTHAYFTDNGEHGIISEMMRRCDFPLWVGSEYCEGLNTNTDTAIERGFRGFFTAPLHYLSGNKALEPWMLEAVAASMRKWREHVQH